MANSTSIPRDMPADAPLKAQPESRAKRQALRYRRISPNVDLDALELFIRMISAQQARNAAHVKRLKAAGLGKKTGQYALLGRVFLSADQRMTAKELGDAMAVGPSNITRLAEGLEKEGLITRELDEQDKRFSVIGLTEAGKVTAQQFLPQLIRCAEDIASEFTKSELTLFNDLLDRFQRRAETLGQ